MCLYVSTLAENMLMNQCTMPSEAEGWLLLILKVYLAFLWKVKAAPGYVFLVIFLL